MPEDNKAALASRHKKEWDDYRISILNSALTMRDEKECKTAKVLADCIRLTQDGERRAYAFAEAGEIEPEAISYSWQE